MTSSLTDRLQQAFGCFNARDLAGAERMCRDILRDIPGNPDALHLLGVARLIGGNPQEAASLISRALKSNPRDTAMLENLGVAQLAASEPIPAEAQFRRALALGASQASIHMRLGLALSAQGKLAEATHRQSAARRRRRRPVIAGY
jgi:protein O-GlcNAc transferase